MGIVKLNPYLKLNNEELINLTLNEIDNLKLISYGENMAKYNQKKRLVNQLIKEIKRRDISLQLNQLRDRILL